MDKMARLIGLYSTCFVICLAVTIAAGAVTAFLFFRFNIRKIFLIRSGRAGRRGIRAPIHTAEEKNAAAANPEGAASPPGFRFEITEYTVIVHTDEIIEQDGGC